jgi:hypothetical protein
MSSRSPISAATRFSWSRALLPIRRCTDIWLAAFVRLAPAQQQSALWRSVGEAMQRRLSKKPVWLSTAGAGVPWLHVRLDDLPKYYGYRPYRQPSWWHRREQGMMDIKFDALVARIVRWCSPDPVDLS